MSGYGNICATRNRSHSGVLAVLGTGANIKMLEMTRIG